MHVHICACFWCVCALEGGAIIGVPPCTFPRAFSELLPNLNQLPLPVDKYKLTKIVFIETHVHNTYVCASIQ